MCGRYQTTRRCGQALALVFALLGSWCGQILADDGSIDFDQSASDSSSSGRVSHAQWFGLDPREVFAPAASESSPLPPEQPRQTLWQPQPESNFNPPPLVSDSVSQPAAPTSSLNGPIFVPTSDHLFDGLSVFGGLDGSKQPQDLGVNANLGGRFAFNWGRVLVEEWHLGIQVGAGIDFSDNAVQVLNRLGVNDGRQQLFTTVGLFQRTDWGFNWNFVHDSLYERYYGNFNLSQWRGRAGYQVTDTDELGVWGTIADSGDSGSVLGTPINLKPISQANFFWRHTWSNSAWTTLWLGSAKEHGRFVLVLPDQPAVKNAFVYGADLQMPLNDWWALYGEANFITPASSGTVDAYLGFVFYPGGGAFKALQKRYAPLLQTASNASFAVDLPR